MPRYRLDIEYDGTPYSGWQRQAGQHSVQAAIEQAVFAFCREEITLRGAGRTDAGVHATAQVAHFDLEKDWPADTVRDAVNAHLQLAGERVSILIADKALPDFDSRFWAVERHYLYRIVNRRAPLALERNKAWWVPRPLDDAAMHEAAVAAARFYGKGSGHPAQLNFSDCLVYAVAKQRDLPLLFVGDDFVHTDITPALPLET